jgi:hypothetical protein
VAIRAPHFALSDFSQNLRPVPATICESRDVPEFLPDVIELEHDNVRLSAIDARMV